jgi:hypothetical protein
VSHFERAATEQNIALAPLSDGIVLFDTGLNSLSIAMIVLRLEESFGYDPFEAEDVKVPSTFGDFVKLYESPSA